MQACVSWGARVPHTRGSSIRARDPSGPSWVAGPLTYRCASAGTNGRGALASVACRFRLGNAERLDAHHEDATLYTASLAVKSFLKGLGKGLHKNPEWMRHHFDSGTDSTFHMFGRHGMGLRELCAIYDLMGPFDVTHVRIRQVGSSDAGDLAYVLAEGEEAFEVKESAVLAGIAPAGHRVERAFYCWLLKAEPTGRGWRAVHVTRTAAPPAHDAPGAFLSWDDSEPADGTADHPSRRAASA